jgi:shikimate kinase
LDKPLAIVGYMGSGKTTVGRLVARRLRREFVDLDAEVSRRAGRSIPEIFEQYGEDRFRDLEQQELARAFEGTSERVVACGGGVILRPENRERLKGAATVFLEEDLDVLYARTRGRDRPLRASSSEEFRSRYAERLPLYLEVADLRVAVDGRPQREVAEEIARWSNG